jgi:hypothetical protein
VFTTPPNQLPDLSNVKVRGGDYEERALAAAVDRTPLVGNIVEHWVKHAQGIRTFAFAVTVAHSKHIVDRFRGVGIAAEHLDGTTPTALRDGMLRRLAEGETLIVSSVGCTCEGVDIPAVKCAILARPTKSTGLYLQQAGRILRPWNDVRAILLDHGGCAQMHGLPHDDREFSLDGDARRLKQKEGERKHTLKTRICTQCFAVVASTVSVCPECGFQFPKALVPEEASGALVEVAGDFNWKSDPRLIEWQKLVLEAAQRGFKPGWAYYRFKERYGIAPPKSFELMMQAPRAPEPSLDKRALYRDLLATETSPAWATARYAVMTGELPPQDLVG